jgi:hypothetical protein
MAHVAELNNQNASRQLSRLSQSTSLFHTQTLGLHLLQCAIQSPSHTRSMNNRGHVLVPFCFAIDDFFKPLIHGRIRMDFS